ncbi:MAG: tetratricopeptide repeat protein, partial [Terriglobales bacterium]
MALGFGFNKAKVLASAEKYVQQGKLQNAIGEYEKVAKEDAKDLTVLNTIGDLYARLGQVDKATASFRKVGDHYASDGFTVKAIAMYKKLTKLNPSAVDAVQRLAEFYTQQGLYNDARQQYVAVAEYWLKNNDQAAAAGVFNKMLELDPDNAAVQTKLADLYIKLGKKEDAKEIFFRAADSLHMRGALDAADEALGKILNIDPTNARALMKRSQLAMDQGDGATATRMLGQVSNLDANPDGLALLLRARLMTGEADAAENAARTLVQSHKDFSGIS